MLRSRALRLSKKNISQAQPPSLDKLDKVIELAERDCIFADEGHPALRPLEKLVV
jgi:hypothetical protein